MSIEAQKTEAEIEESINIDLEAAADEAFGTDVEVAALAAEEAGKQTPEDSAEQIVKDEERRAAEKIAKENDGKSPEEIAKAEEDKKAAEEKADDEKLAKENEGKTPEEITKAEEDKKALQEKEDAEKPYEVPDDLKGRTRDRFEKLIGNLKEADQTVEKQKGILEGFKTALSETGLNPQEIERTLALGSMMKKEPAKALEELTVLVTALSKQLGVVPPGENALEGHDDLKQKVADRELSVTDATEIARARVKLAAEQTATKRVEEKQAQAQLADQQKGEADKVFGDRVATAQVNIQTFLKGIEKDPDYEAIGPHLVTAAKHAAENLAPEKWLEYISGEHRKIKEISSAMLPAATDTPIMDSGAPKNTKQEPKNLEQLADQML